VYDLPFVRAVTVSGDDAPETLPATPPLLDVHVAVKLVTAVPSSGPAKNVVVS